MIINLGRLKLAQVQNFVIKQTMSKSSIFIRFLPVVIHICMGEDVTLELKQGTVVGQRDLHHG